MHDTCADVMIPNPATLHPNMTLGEAVAKLLDVRVRYLPVVDDNGDFVGTFSSMTVIRMLLPQSVSIKEGKNPFELSFMHTTVEELQARLGERGNDPIAAHIQEEKLKICTPDTGMMEAINLLYKHHYQLVVCEPNSRKFLGVVSISGVLRHVAG